MKLYEIWSEGYRCNVDRGEATLHGRTHAINFKEACNMLAMMDKGFAAYFDPKTMTYWGCGLFDSEQKARRNFG